MSVTTRWTCRSLTFVELKQNQKCSLKRRRKSGHNRQHRKTLNVSVFGFKACGLTARMEIQSAIKFKQHLALNIKIDGLSYLEWLIALEGDVTFTVGYVAVSYSPVAVLMPRANNNTSTNQQVRSLQTPLAHFQGVLFWKRDQCSSRVGCQLA